MLEELCHDIQPCHRQLLHARGDEFDQQLANLDLSMTLQCVHLMLVRRVMSHRKALEFFTVV